MLIFIISANIFINFQNHPIFQKHNKLINDLIIENTKCAVFLSICKFLSITRTSKTLYIFLCKMHFLPIHFYVKMFKFIEYLSHKTIMLLYDCRVNDDNIQINLTFLCNHYLISYLPYSVVSFEFFYYINIY